MAFPNPAKSTYFTVPPLRFNLEFAIAAPPTAAPARTPPPLFPLITEKNTGLQAGGKYAFEVAREANKPQIKQAVEKAFKVKVTAVNVLTAPGKTRRVGRRQVLTHSWKKAIVRTSMSAKNVGVRICRNYFQVFPLDKAARGAIHVQPEHVDFNRKGCL